MKHRQTLWCLSWILFLSCVLAQDPVVVIPQGRLIGTRVFTENSPIPIETFFGIPYATPPVGRRRFAAPERHPGWRRTLFAHRQPPRCPQPSDDSSGYYNEDCLYLNIWTPRRVETNLLPVVIVLYSESWLHTDVATLPCQELAAEGIVVVLVAFRLHMLGFFTLQSQSARGNLALLDQYMAIMWVRENIAAFGGDPGIITLLGHSAGADSILYHLSSPRTGGLFRRVIVMSPREVWNAIETNKPNDSKAREQGSRELAHNLGCELNNTSLSDEDLLKCVIGRPLDLIIKTYNLKNKWSDEMRPTSDLYLPESERYLPRSLSQALSTSNERALRLDIMLGTVDLEATEIEGEIYSSNTQQIVISQILHLLRLHKLLQPQDPPPPALVQAVKWEYLNKSSSEGLLRMVSSGRWGAGIALLGEVLARSGRLYLYRFSQPMGTDLRGRTLNYTGAAFGTDLVSVLGDAMMQQVARRRATPEERRTTTYFRNYIVQFIKFGSPSGDTTWKQYHNNSRYVHEIRTTDMHNGNRAMNDIIFWLQYLPQLADLLFSPGRLEPLNSNQDDKRLRGAVYALTGLATILLVLLFVCAVLMRFERQRLLRNSFNE